MHPRTFLIHPLIYVYIELSFVLILLAFLLSKPFRRLFTHLAHIPPRNYPHLIQRPSSDAVPPSERANPLVWWQYPTPWRLVRLSAPLALFTAVCTFIWYFLWFFVFYSCSYSGRTGSLQAQALLDVARAFRTASLDAGVRFWPDYGTLLGVVRSGRMLPYDLDIDICVFEDDRELATNKVLPLLHLQGIRATPHAVGWKSGWRLRKYSGAWWDDELFVDIFFFKDKGNTTGHWKYHAPQEWVDREVGSQWFGRTYAQRNDLNVPKHYLEPMGSMYFEGDEWPVPNSVEDFLVWRFGVDWKVPQLKFYGRANVDTLGVRWGNAYEAFGERTGIGGVCYVWWYFLWMVLPIVFALVGLGLSMLGLVWGDALVRG